MLESSPLGADIPSFAQYYSASFAHYYFGANAIAANSCVEVRRTSRKWEPEYKPGVKTALRKWEVEKKAAHLPLSELPEI